MIYWIILFIFFILFSLNKYKLRVLDQSFLGGKTSRPKKAYIIFCAIVLVVIAGLRSTKVGADTSMYKTLFEYASKAKSLRLGYSSWQSGSVEPGFYFVEYFFAKHLNFQAFLFFAAIISIVPVMIVIYKYSKNYFYSMFLYISFGYFSFAMNGLRQAIAIGICMIAYLFYRKRKPIMFIFFVIFAFTFHKSAILFLPVYWLGKIPKKKDIIYIYIVSLIVLFILRKPIFSLLNRFSRQQFVTATNQGGFRMFLVMLATTLTGWFAYNRFIKRNTNSIYSGLVSKENWHQLMTVSIAVLMWPIASVNAELNRMYYYYHIFILLYVPSVARAVKRDERLVFNMIYMIIGIYYLYSYIINGSLSYSPYLFYWQ